MTLILRVQLLTTKHFNMSVSNHSHLDQMEIYEQYYSKGSLFPDALVLAKLSNEVYYSKPKPPVKIQTEDCNDWVLVAVVKSKPSFQLFQGYYGEAYFNPRTKQLVIAHRGTTICLRDFVADVKLALNFKTGYSDRAYNFSLNVIKKMSDKAISVTITGHSLGGYLAQTTAFYLKLQEGKEKITFKVRENAEWLVDPEQWPSFGYSNKFHVHVVVFDSPGAGIHLQETLCQLSPEMSMYARNTFIFDLDITVYISKLNAVNTCNGYFHVGRLLFMKEVKGIVGKMSGETHSIRNIIQYLETPSANISEVNVWKSGFGGIQTEHLETLADYSIDPNIYQWNVFTSKEKDFLKSLKRGVNTDISRYLESGNVLRRIEGFKFEILVERNQFLLAEAGQVNVFISAIKFLSRFDRSLNHVERAEKEVGLFSNSVKTSFPVTSIYPNILDELSICRELSTK